MPDWRDPAAHGAVGEWSLDRWRWEFRRRRDDLCEYFDQRLASEIAGRAESALSGLCPDEPGFLIEADPEAAQRFGYVHGLPNPRVGDQPEWAIRTYAPFEIDPGIVDSDNLPLGKLVNLAALTDPPAALLRAAWESGLSAHESREMLVAASEGVGAESLRDLLLQHLSGCTPLFLKEGQIALTFSLDQPLANQLEAAAAILKAKQTARHGQKIQRRTHKERWLAYLRALDARAAGATYALMRDHFYAEGILDRHDDPGGTYREPPLQAARNLWVQADRLCFNF